VVTAVQSLSSVVQGFSSKMDRDNAAIVSHLGRVTERLEDTEFKMSQILQSLARSGPSLQALARSGPSQTPSSPATGTRSRFNNSSGSSSSSSEASSSSSSGASGGLLYHAKKTVDIEEGALARLLAVDVSQSIGAIMIELAKHKIPFGHLGWKTDLSNNNVSLVRKARVLMLAVATSAEKTEWEVANRVAALAAPVDDSAAAAAAGAAAAEAIAIAAAPRSFLVLAYELEKRLKLRIKKEELGVFQSVSGAESKVLTISSLGRRLQKIKNKLPEVDAAMHKPPKDQDLRTLIVEASSTKAVVKKPTAAKRKAASGKGPRKRLAVSGISGVHEEGGKEQATAAAAVAAEEEPTDELTNEEEGGR
jgi:hypothetical protein